MCKMSYTVKCMEMLVETSCKHNKTIQREQMDDKVSGKDQS